MSEHLDFVHKMTKLALEHAKQEQPQHLGVGGIAGPSGGVAPDNQLVTTMPISSGSAPGSSGGILGGVSSLLGLNNTFQPTATNITPGTNTGQLNTAYNATQNALGTNQGITNTLNPGIAQGAGLEATLADQLAAESAGQGPNPAQAQLNQATGQNAARTAALLASQRGAGTNAGSIGAQGARTGAEAQQESVGQAATLAAQQQLTAQQQAANLAATQVNQGQNAAQSLSQQQQGEQQILQGANAAANNAAVTAQGGLNAVNAQIAGENQRAHQGLVGGILGGLSAAAGPAAAPIAAALGFAKGGLVKMDRGGNVLDEHARSEISSDNFALPGRRYPIHDASHARNALARVSQYGTPSEKTKVKAAVHKKYPEMSKQHKNEGGAIAGYAAGGSIQANPLTTAASIQPQSFVGQWLNSNGNPTIGAPTIQSMPVDNSSDTSIQQGASLLGKALRSTKATADKSPGDPDAGGGGSGSGFVATAGEAHGGTIPKYSEGTTVPGKPKVDHDDLKNDTVPVDVSGGGKAMLTPGELVIDLNTMKDPGPMGQMARALAKHIEAKKKGKK